MSWGHVCWYIVLSSLQCLKNMVRNASWHMWYHIWKIYNNVPAAWPAMSWGHVCWYIVLSLLHCLKNMVRDVSWHTWYYTWKVNNNVLGTWPAMSWGHVCSYIVLGLLQCLKTWIGMSSDICGTTFEMFITMSQGHDQPYLGDMYLGTSF